VCLREDLPRRTDGSEVCSGSSQKILVSFISIDWIHLGCAPKVFNQILWLGRSSALLQKLAGCAQCPNLLCGGGGDELIQRHSVNLRKFGSRVLHGILCCCGCPRKFSSTASVVFSPHHVEVWGENSYSFAQNKAPCSRSVTPTNWTRGQSWTDRSASRSTYISFAFAAH
jgi:hypothetical protein